MYFRKIVRTFCRSPTQIKSVFDPLHTLNSDFSLSLTYSSLIENCTVALSVGVLLFCARTMFSHRTFSPFFFVVACFSNHYIDPFGGIISCIAINSSQMAVSGIVFGPKMLDESFFAELYRFFERVAINLLNAFLLITFTFKMQSNSFCIIYGKFADSLLM